MDKAVDETKSETLWWLALVFLKVLIQLGPYSVSPFHFITCSKARMEHFPSETNLENPAISMQILR